ncbi:MAG: quinoprotein dehydrogenase-associated SoxYZ-like carrier [Rhodocyclaceae bacterium]|nr:quinoprotein dehydrogenase-associated SoxYZ-like carrier [Rhodocyclaceae bacterium]MBX3666798.1 quinoprotein dehydrogenase-associated SoxYZ-like carrier [Rhodocyclaceae bacterium]
MRALVFSLTFILAGTAHAAPPPPDPFGSGLWPDVHAEFLGREPVVFDDRVKVVAPAFAEDPMAVPVSVDASALGAVSRVVVLVDRNPIRKVLEFFPQAARPVLAFRFKLQQGSPVRAAARTADGVWHLGGTWVDGSGGGCTLPGGTRSDGSWVRTLGQVQGRMFDHGDASRLRVRIMHPMDTGLVSGIPAFYLDELQLRDDAGTAYMRILTFEPVSENPVFSFDLGTRPAGSLHLQGRDNNGNLVAARIDQQKP